MVVPFYNAGDLKSWTKESAQGQDSRRWAVIKIFRELAVEKQAPMTGVAVGTRRSVPEHNIGTIAIQSVTNECSYGSKARRAERQ
jgi:hypothetical protein